MTRTLLAATLVAFSIASFAESRVTYVGGGRYTCQGNAADCAHINQSNRRESGYRAQQYQQEQDGAQSVVDRERSKDEARRNDQRRNP